MEDIMAAANSCLEGLDLSAPMTLSADKKSCAGEGGLTLEFPQPVSSSTLDNFLVKRDGKRCFEWRYSEDPAAPLRRTISMSDPTRTVAVTLDDSIRPPTAELTCPDGKLFTAATQKALTDCEAPLPWVSVPLFVEENGAVQLSVGAPGLSSRLSCKSK
ncbi:MAG: hypothetical protein U0271_39275 [Polyangiaceae bacterium]